jgi:hypothetical protein
MKRAYVYVDGINLYYGVRDTELIKAGTTYGHIFQSVCKKCKFSDSLVYKDGRTTIRKFPEWNI